VLFVPAAAGLSAALLAGAYCRCYRDVKVRPADVMGA
jgi:hypothetical protein